MIQIRAGVFETNSSSTHSLCIMTQDDFNKWVSSHNGEYYLLTVMDMAILSIIVLLMVLEAESMTKKQ